MKRGSDKATSSQSSPRRGINMDPVLAEENRKSFLDNVSVGIIKGIVDGEDLTPSPKTKHAPGNGNILQVGQTKISKIVTGGQTGVDRASLDFACKVGLNIGGWCPRGGWAEDMQTAPGLLASYPEMQETSSDKFEQRTQWNVRDSDATLIFAANNNSSGTNLTADTAEALGLPYKVVQVGKVTPGEVRSWLAEMPEVEVLNLAGPRESENPGSYQYIQNFLESVFKEQSD